MDNGAGIACVILFFIVLIVCGSCVWSNNRVYRQMKKKLVNRGEGHLVRSWMNDGDAVPEIKIPMRTTETDSTFVCNAETIAENQHLANSIMEVIVSQMRFIQFALAVLADKKEEAAQYFDEYLQSIKKAQGFINEYLSTVEIDDRHYNLVKMRDQVVSDKIEEAEDIIRKSRAKDVLCDGYHQFMYILGDLQKNSHFHKLMSDLNRGVFIEIDVLKTVGFQVKEVK